MASFKQYTASGGASEAFSIPTFSSDEIKVYVDGVLKTATTHYNITSYTVNGGTVTWTTGNVPNGVVVRIVRDTDVSSARATYSAGSSIKAGDLNDNQTQALRALEEDDHLIQGYDFEDGVITSAKFKDAAITTAKLADGSVTTAKIAADAITTAKIADDAVTQAKLANNSVGGSQIINGAIDSNELADNAVTTAKIADGQITQAKLGSVNIIGTDQIVNSAVTSDKLAVGAVITAKLDNNAVTTGKIADGQVTTAKIAADAIDGTKIADNAIGSEHIAANAVTTSEIADAELTTLAGMQSGTASILASGTALTATLAEINTVVDGKSVETTISDTDAAYPTSGAVVDYVAAQIAPIGGLEVIATDAAFPNTQPAAGVVISIADAGGLVVSSGTSTTARTVGGSTVTINNIASNFNGSTIADGVAMMVSSTGSGQIYNYHKATLKEADLLSLSNDINDFAERYRVHNFGNGNPSNPDEGDLAFDTNANKMKVYDGSSWGEVTSTGDFKFLVAVDAGTTTAATFDGSDTSFDLKEATNSGSAASVSNINQLMVVLNGVVQKPNAGSWSASNEGFHLTDADTIRFCTAPATGSTCFIVQSGSAVSIPTPGNNTVSTDTIQNLAVTQGKLANEAVNESKLQVSNSPTNGYVLTAQSGNTGGLTWAEQSATGGAVGGGSDTVFWENGQTVTTNYTITNNTNAGSFGPITINSGVTVTVGSGENWTIV
tara:strand:- start:2907 stop:5075 length:2169 start_codon:yes stop_codon:yes gene_type:complete